MEKQLESWIPRRPSPKIEARLFGRERRLPVVPSHVWNWLTPAAACVLTLLVVLTGPSHHSVSLESATLSPIASVMYDPEACNTPRSFVLSRADANVDLNFWSRPYHPLMDGAHFAPGTNHSSNSAEL